MPVNVLFICVHNSARSQMAEEYMNRLGEGRFTAESAGLEPTEIMPEVIEVMREDGADLSTKKTNSVFGFYREGRLYDVVITVCDETAEDRCPIFPGVAHRLRLPFPDPQAFAGTPDEKLALVRELRDQIKKEIKEFMDWYESGYAKDLSSRWQILDGPGRASS